MSDNTRIEWTDATWNPVTGCSVHSPGCTNCYAMKLAGTRLRDHPSRAGLTKDTKAGPVWTGEIRFNEDWLTQPLKWQRPRRVFVCAHADLFHEAVPAAWIDRVFAVMALAPQHQFQVLTKRSARMREWFAADGLPRRVLFDQAGEGRSWHNVKWPLPNVWLGVSVEDQARADERIPDLLATPAAIRWLSCEPLLGPVDLRLGGPFQHVDPAYWGAYQARLQGRDRPIGKGAYRGWADADLTLRHHPDLSADGQGINWIVAGGESGPPHARPMHPDWARSLRDQCAAAGVPFHFKQWGAFRPLTAAEANTACGATRVDCDTFGPASMLPAAKKITGRELDGQLHDGFPA